MMWQIQVSPSFLSWPRMLQRPAPLGWSNPRRDTGEKKGPEWMLYVDGGLVWVYMWFQGSLPGELDQLHFFFLPDIDEFAFYPPFNHPLSS